MLRRCADLAGRAPLRQISNHAAAQNLIAVQDPLLGAAPGNLRHSPGVMGLVHAARTPVTGDFTAHHRGATPNRASDTHLGQASLQPHHNRRAILNTEHPTTAHNQPLQQHCYHTNCLHPMTLPSTYAGSTRRFCFIYSILLLGQQLYNDRMKHRALVLKSTPTTGREVDRCHPS